MKYVYFPAQQPAIGPGACASCMGYGITGERVAMPGSDHGPLLIVDLLCPSCGGCGRAEHNDCATGLHIGDDDPEFDTPDTDDDGREPCPSCHGRTWWIMTGFTDDGVSHMRVPCGCNTSLVEAAE